MNTDKLKQSLLDDPMTQQIAENLGVDLDEYVEQVVHYATHTDEDPEVRVVDDDVLVDKGFEVNSAEEIEAWIAAALSGATFTATGETDSDGFGDDGEDKKRRVLSAALAAAQQIAAPNVTELKGEIKVADDQAGSVLKQQLLGQRMNRQMQGHMARRNHRK